MRLNFRAYICHLNFRILLTLKYRESSSNTKHGRSTSPTYVLKYENIKCQQLPLILKMKLPIKLGSNAFLGYFIFFSFGRLQSDMDFYVLYIIQTFYSSGKVVRIIHIQPVACMIQVIQVLLVEDKAEL